MGRNLSGPLAELTQRLSAAGMAVSAIRIATRSGDRDSAERGPQQRRPSEIVSDDAEAAEQHSCKSGLASQFRDILAI